MQSVQPLNGSNGVVLVRAPDVIRHLPMKDCIAAMEQAFRTLEAGRAVQPVRQVIRIPAGTGALYSMPAFLAGTHEGRLAVKLVTVYPGNAGRGIETHQGVIALFDASDGRVLAMIEAASVTAIRTAAVSALATRLLALPDASELAILGSGVQAGSHLAAMIEVRRIRRVRVWSRSAGRAAAFAAAASARHEVEVEGVDTPERALANAQIVCTVTASATPITRSDWIEPGTHINAVGASTAAAREIDTATVARARIVVDSRDAALVEAGDILIPMDEGTIGRDTPLTELCDVVAGSAAPRTSASDVTLFESLGLAVEDVAAAHTLYERALAAGIDRVDFG